MQAAAHRLTDVTECSGAATEVVIVGTGRILGRVKCICVCVSGCVYEEEMDFI